MTNVDPTSLSENEAEASPRRFGPAARTAALLVLGVLLTATTAIVYGAVAPARPTPAGVAATVQVDSLETTPVPSASSPAPATLTPPPSSHVTTRHPTAAPKTVRPPAKAPPTSARTAPAPKPSSAAPVWKSATIGGTTVLSPGASWSTNRLLLTLATNGDVTLADQGKVVWRAGTAGRGGTQLIMQADGNLVLYSRNGATVWSTRTDLNDGAVLVLGSDGSLTIQIFGRLLWSARG